MANGKWQMANGKSRMANGKWQRPHVAIGHDFVAALP
jgi:hypothetical protein